ncbi:hypothetical protein AVEN_38944-1 [Araneus ventricosus]|uniref:Uncharacterized protein n=1 Tax=Araneus ventricosus TaxID=182803 RepID=A0A4Y2VKL9_ARAVE|nr:hypothetical protein AVEN_38944-1 [Araneus ventricosus]
MALAPLNLNQPTNQPTDTPENVCPTILPPPSTARKRAADASIAKRSPFRRKYRRPWRNDACRDACREQRNPTKENLIAFTGNGKCASNPTSKSDSWIRFLSSITSNTSSADLWKKGKAGNGICKEFTFPVINTGTGSYSSPPHVANAIGEFFADNSSSSSYNRTFLRLRDGLSRCI